MPSRISDTQVHIVLAAAMLVSAGFSLWLSRGTTFTGDELNWIIDTPGSISTARSSPTTGT